MATVAAITPAMIRPIELLRITAFRAITAALNNATAATISLMSIYMGQTSRVFKKPFSLSY